MVKKQCGASHTKYQPSESEFVCPGCGEKDGDFFIDTFSDDTGADNDCLLLHDEDVLRCCKCNYETTGKKFANMIAKRKDLVQCPCCEGRGLVWRKLLQKGG